MSVDQTTIASVMKAMRITDEDYVSEVTELIEAAVSDLGIAGVIEDDMSDPLILTAIKTYCRMRFGQPDDYDDLKAAYDEQKAQLQTATGYTNWGDD